MGKLIAWLLALGIIFSVGATVGDRYGLPAPLAMAVAPAFEAIESRMGGGTVVETIDQDAEKATNGEYAGAVAAIGGIDENRALRINEAGLDIIKRSEGLRLEAYSLGGRDYIGYGHQMAPGEPRQITEAQAEALLRQDVKVAEDGVRRALMRPANSNQFSAMVSLAYNIGTGRFGNNSQVPVLFNKGNVQGAANAFLNHNKAGGRVLDHLTHRREEERTLFLTPS